MGYADDQEQSIPRISGGGMSAEFLKWFLAQKPFRRARLMTTCGIEHVIEKPDEIVVEEHGMTYRLYAVTHAGLKTYRGTYSLGDIEEIRQ